MQCVQERGTVFRTASIAEATVWTTWLMGALYCVVNMELSIVEALGDYCKRS